MKGMFKRIAPIIIAVVLVALNVVPLSAATTADVTVTATPEFLAITNSEASWAIGSVAESATKWWTSDGNAPDAPFTDGDMKSTITNAGSVASDVDIKVAAFIGGVGWTISTDDSPGVNEISIRAGITGTANEAAMVQVITTDTELVSNLAASGTKLWCMEAEFGTFTDGVEKTGTVTLTISKH